MWTQFIENADEFVRDFVEPPELSAMYVDNWSLYSGHARVNMYWREDPEIHNKDICERSLILVFDEPSRIQFHVETEHEFERNTCSVQFSENAVAIKTDGETQPLLTLRFTKCFAHLQLSY